MKLSVGEGRGARTLLIALALGFYVGSSMKPESDGPPPLNKEARQSIQSIMTKINDARDKREA